VSVVNAAIVKFKDYWKKRTTERQEEIINGMIRPASWFQREITRDDAIEMIENKTCSMDVEVAWIFADYTDTDAYREILGLERLINVSNSSSDTFDRVYLSSDHAGSLARFF